MKLTKNQAKQIRALKRMKDEEIDFTDIPEKTDWSNVVVGKFYRPSQKSTIRVIKKVATRRASPSTKKKRQIARQKRFVLMASKDEVGRVSNALFDKQTALNIAEA
ncbi:MAG TPA: hypothetical protein VGK24_03190 [Candidatus Angelobacter sp.]|jgi:serine/threonine protein kinase HipA of HipAB toxin-antitoxin module